jgi:hypothetical protein
MLVFAYGLQQRSRSAWGMSAVLLWAGAVWLMLKGFAWEDATVLVLLLIILVAAGREFQAEAHHLLSSTLLAGWSRLALCSPLRPGSACFHTSTSTTQGGGTSRSTIMPPVCTSFDRGCRRGAWCGGLSFAERDSISTRGYSPMNGT